jgi:uncharacterized protein
MRTIFNIFGKSPFAPLQEHMENVAICVYKLPLLFQALEAHNLPLLDQIAQEIYDVEHKADLIKNGIRSDLPKSLFLPIDRSQLLEVLSIQDKIADTVEDVAVLLTLKPLELLIEFKDIFSLFIKKNIEAFEGVLYIIREVQDLIESSFGGLEADRVKIMIDQVVFKEHEVDLIQRELIKKLFQAESSLTFITFYQWQKIFESIAAISNLSENLANRIRLTLELK